MSAGGQPQFVMIGAAEMLKVLAGVATARDLAQLEQQCAQAQMFEVWLQHEAGVAPDAAGRNQRPAMEGLVYKPKIIKEMCRALARALQLLSQQHKQKQGKPAAALRQQSGAARTAWHLLKSFNMFDTAWRQSGTPATHDSDNLHVARQVAESGLLSSIEQSSRSVAARLKAAMQPSSSSSSSSSLLGVLVEPAASLAVTICGSVVVNCYTTWPGAAPLAAAALRPCFQPVVDLACAVLEAAGAAGLYTAGSSSSCSSSNSSSSSSDIGTWDILIALSVRLAGQLSCLLGCARSCDPSLPAWRPHAQLFASDALLKLLLVHVGISVGQLYKQQQQQQQGSQPGVQAYHQQLLAELGVQPTEQQRGATIAECSMTCSMPHACEALLFAMDMRAAASHSSSSGSSASCSDRGVSAASSAAAAAGDIRLVELALLTVHEYAVLSSAVDESYLEPALHCIVGIHQHGLMLCSSTAAGDASSLQEALCTNDVLLQSLLLELAPAVMRSTCSAAVSRVASYALAAADDGDDADDESLASVRGRIVRLLVLLSHDALQSAMLQPELPTAVQQRPHKTAALLEAALRSLAADQDQAGCRIDADVALNWLELASTTMQRLADEATWPADPAATNQLFGLGTSILKTGSLFCCHSYASRVSSSSSSLLLGTVLHACNRAASVSLDGFPAKLLLLLKARFLGLCGKVYSMRGSEAWAADQEVPAAASCMTTDIVQECIALLNAAQLPGEAAAAAEAVQQLQQQAAALAGILQMQQQLLQASTTALILQLQHSMAGHRRLIEARDTNLEQLGQTEGGCTVLPSVVQPSGDAAAAAAATEAAQQVQLGAAVLQQQMEGVQACLGQMQAMQQPLGQNGGAGTTAPPPAAAAAAAAVAGGSHGMSAAGTAEAAAAAAAEHGECMRLNLQHQELRAGPEELLQQLQQFGEVVCHQLPVRLWCCNPRCTNLQQQSELELVGGKSCVCSGCQTARFCSRQCLEQCWKKQLHKGVCKRIAAGRQQ